MADMATDRFQGSCFAKEDGAGISYMMCFDVLPEEARERLRNSPYNLCVACALVNGNKVPELLTRIEHMEHIIRKGESNGISCDDPKPNNTRIAF